MSEGWFKKFLEKYISFSWLIVLLFTGLTFVLAPKAVSLMSKVSTELSQLLPETHPSVSLINKVKNQFNKEGGGDLILVFESPNQQLNEKVVDDISAYFLSMPEVKQVRKVKKGHDFFAKHKLLLIEQQDLITIKDRIKRKIQNEKLKGFYIDFESDDNKKDPLNFSDLMNKYGDFVKSANSPYYRNEEGTLYYIKIFPSTSGSSLDENKIFLKFATEKLKAFNWSIYPEKVKIHYAGSIKSRLDEYNALISDLKKAGTISFVGIFLVLVLYFRRVVAVVLLFLPLVSGIILGFYLCSLFISSLNVITSFLFSILLGLGVDIGIHMMDRYLEDRESGIDRLTSLANILLKTGRSSATSVFTTVAAFFILIFNDFKGFSEFGYIAGIGLLMVLVCYLLIFPSVLVIAEQIKILRFGKHRAQLTEKLIQWLPQFPHPKKIIFICLVLFFGSVFLLPKLSFEWNYKKLKMNVAETAEAKEKLKQITARVNSPAAVIIKSAEEAKAIKEEVLRRKRNDPTTSIDAFRSSYDFFPEDQKERYQLLKEIDNLLADDVLNVLKGDQKKGVEEFRQAIADTRIINFKDVPEELLESFKSLDHKSNEQIAFIYPRAEMELDDGHNSIKFFEDVHHLKINGEDKYAVSDALIFADVLTTMFSDSKQAIVLTFLALVILVYLDFRNLKKTFIILFTLTASMLVMLGCCVLFEWKFNFYNMVTIPVVLGMGEDNGVHIIHRLEELGPGQLMKVLFTSGMAAMMASLTTILGYSGLAFAHHPGLNSIGNFAILGMTTCMVGSFVFLPALLVTLTKTKIKS